MEAADRLAISKSPLFQRVRPADVAAILGDAEPEDLPRGHELVGRGEVIDQLPLILSGWVRIYRSGEDGGEAVVAIVGPGRAIGEAAALLGRPAHAGAATITPARIVRIDVARLRSRIVGDADLAFAMLASAALHLRGMVGALERLAALSGPRRLAGFLCDLLPEDGRPAAFDLPYEKSLIAAQLGMTPESLSRAIARLKKHGVVVTRERVEIARPEMLRAYLAGERG
jgi:CRP-like cAMP-binding protein